MKKETSVTNIMRNVMPAFAVMALGLGGAYLVYENYFSDSIEGRKYSSIAPAAGSEMGGMESMTGITSDMKVMVSDMAEHAEHAMDAAGDMAHDAMEATGEMASDAAEAADDAMHDAVEGATDEATEGVSYESAGEMVDDAADAAEDMGDDAADAVEEHMPSMGH